MQFKTNLVYELHKLALVHYVLACSANIKISITIAVTGHLHWDVETDVK